MEEYYNIVDQKQLKLSQILSQKGLSTQPYKPVERNEEGYIIKYSAMVFRPKLDSTWLSDFYQYYWVDNEYNEKDRNERINKFLNLNVPVEFVGKVNDKYNATQIKKISGVELTKRMSLNDLLVESVIPMQEEIFYKLTKKINDFQTKVTINKVNPIEAKIGKKEGLYVDERFYIYEISSKQNGGNSKQVKNRIGFARVTKNIADNTSIANGQTPTTVFKQIGGKKVYEGMFLELHEDKGWNLFFDYGITPSNVFHIGYEFNWASAKAFGRSTSTKAPRGLYFGIEGIFCKSKSSTLDSYTTPGTNSLFLGISKEIYPLINGVFLQPRFSIGYNLENNNPVGCFSFGVGYNLIPQFTLLAKFNKSIIGDAYPFDFNMDKQIKSGVTLGIKIRF
jgi:hypothetical protein